jgi:hypothetical protein
MLRFISDLELRLFPYFPGDDFEIAAENIVRELAFLRSIDVPLRAIHFKYNAPDTTDDAQISFDPCFIMNRLLSLAYTPDMETRDLSDVIEEFQHELIQVHKIMMNLEVDE